MKSAALIAFIAVAAASCTAQDDADATPVASAASSTLIGGTPSSASPHAEDAANVTILSDVGGTVDVAGGGSISFDGGDLSADTEVTASLEYIPDTQTGELVSVGPAMSVELHGEQPTRPVTIRIPLDDDVDVGKGGVLLGTKGDSDTWEYVEATWDPTTNAVTADVPHFSWWNPFSWCWSCFFDHVSALADQASQGLGLITGTRVAQPTCANAPPDWLDGFVVDDAASAALQGCVEAEGDVAVVRVANNRPYGIILTSPVPFAWSVVDYPIPANDLVRQAVSAAPAAKFGDDWGADWMYLPGTTTGWIGIAKPADGFVQLTAGAEPLTVSLDVLHIAIKEATGFNSDDTLFAFTLKLSVACFVEPLTTKPVPDSLAGYTDWFRVAGDCLSQVELHDMLDALPDFAVSQAELDMMSRVRGFFRGLDLFGYVGALGDVIVDAIVNRTYPPTLSFLVLTPVVGGSFDSPQALLDAFVAAVNADDLHAALAIVATASNDYAEDSFEWFVQRDQQSGEPPQVTAQVPPCDPDGKSAFCMAFRLDWPRLLNWK